MLLKACNILLHPKYKVNFCTPWNTNFLKLYMPNCTAFLFSFIIITQLLSPYLKTELHLLTVSEMEKFYTLALNFGGWPFSITVTRYFRPKADHSNEMVYRKPIDRRLKTLSATNHAWVMEVFLEPVLPFFG